jgi:adenosylmethionine-8-amino-7-oxononanoate aminotransferase
MDIAPNSWEARELKSFFHHFTDYGALDQYGPTIIERGDGAYVYDVHGRKYFEANSGTWNIALGYNDKRLIDAAVSQFGQLPAYHAIFARNTPPSVELAERLKEIAPVPIDKVFFTNSGSEANESVAKLLWMIGKAEGHPERRKIIVRYGAYHGATVMATSLTAKEWTSVFGPPHPDVRYADCPHHWRYAKSGQSEEAFTAQLARSLEEQIEREGPGTIAGFLAEPVMGAGGVIVPPKGYFPAIQKVLRKYGIPLIADEIITGFGRTGNLWGSETLGIAPDIIVASKVLTAGYFPLGAVLLSPEIAQRLDTAARGFGEFVHGFTTAGHPVGAAVALAAVARITEPGGLLENIKRLAPRFGERLRKLGGHPLVGEARGVGLMGGLEIVADKTSKVPFDGKLSVGERIVEKAMAKGLILRPTGPAVVLSPPFIMTETEQEWMFDTIEEVLDEVQVGLRR